ncbi:AGAP013387-PA-like protein [Anopheles sinensis]|uniref:AGAP013387-PA-like protein n=1 Tax=Anopheles sinensis TaxID=74873 RepID=A0A084WNZ6_ANOSI|nr:AGAP013387-PA-like protein [Anopheles sinensis]
MDLESIYLVENLSTYNFEDTVFLAADIDAIVEKLMQPLVPKEVEKILFLAHVLKTTIHICRTIVHNYETLEELLKVNWSAKQHGVKKMEFYEKLASDDPVKMICNRILLARDGAGCLGIMQEFYRMHYSKEAFKAMLRNVHKSIPLISANNTFNVFKASIFRTNDSHASLEPPSCDAITRQAKSTTGTDIITLSKSMNSPNFTKDIDEFQERIANPANEEVISKQILMLGKLFNNTQSLKRYQEALKNDLFYRANMMLLKLYHDRLLAKNICYDTSEINVKEIYECCTGLTVDREDGLPRYICDVCCQGLLQFHALRKQMLESNAYLTTYAESPTSM